MNSRPLEVLIVEDNPGDAMLISEMLEEMKLPMHITLAEDGQVALDIMGKKNRSSNNHVPDLVILDLNLPKVDGFDVLKVMKADDNLRSILVVVMTGSLRKEDEIKARSMGVADYCIKPATVEEMRRSTMCLRGYLESLLSGRKSRSSGSSANAMLDVFKPSIRDHRTPPACNEKFVMDFINDEPSRL